VARRGATARRGAHRPGSVRAPWRSRPSGPLQVHKTDSIHWRTPERSELERFVVAIGTKELGSAIGHPALELGAGEDLVGDDGEAGERDPLELLARDLSLGSIAGGARRRSCIVASESTLL
jgi:hypothetical protein